MVTRDDSPQVSIGSVWFVWGHHQRVHAERIGPYGLREVKIAPRNAEKPLKRPWVEAWRVAYFGELSLHQDQD